MTKTCAGNDDVNGKCFWRGGAGRGGDKSTGKRKRNPRVHRIYMFEGSHIFEDLCPLQSSPLCERTPSTNHRPVCNVILQSCLVFSTSAPQCISPSAYSRCSNNHSILGEALLHSTAKNTINGSATQVL